MQMSVHPVGDGIGELQDLARRPISAMRGGPQIGAASLSRMRLTSSRVRFSHWSLEPFGHDVGEEVGAGRNGRCRLFALGQLLAHLAPGIAGFPQGAPQ